MDPADWKVVKTAPPIDAVCAHVREVHAGDEEDQIVDYIRRGVPPSHSIGIVDANGAVASWMCLIRVPLVFDGARITAAQMGIVGTLAKYRKHGLCREVCREFDRIAASERMPLNIIAGIPHFYRKVGYDYGIPMQWWIDCAVPIQKLSELSVGTVDVKADSAKSIAEYLVLRESWSKLVGCFPEFTVEEAMRAASFARLQESSFCAEFHVVRRNGGDGDAVGCFALVSFFGRCLVSELFVVECGDPAAVSRVLAASLLAASQKFPLIPGVYQPVQPAVEAAAVALFGAAAFPAPYAWYTKIQDWSAFIGAISSVISRRLSEGGIEYANYTGEMIMYSFDHSVSSVRLVFSGGRLTSVVNVVVDEPNSIGMRCIGGSPGGATPVIALSPAAAMHLLLGTHSVDSVMEWFPDTIATPDALSLVRVIFPKFNRPLCLGLAVAF